MKVDFSKEKELNPASGVLGILIALLLLAAGTAAKALILLPGSGVVLFLPAGTVVSVHAVSPFPAVCAQAPRRERADKLPKRLHKR